MMRTMATAGGYVRVSSASQNAAMQREAIERARVARGEPHIAWYEDTITGATTKRPGLDALRHDVRQGLISRLYVWRLDRLGRSGIRDTLDLVEELRRNGCELVTLADGFDVAGPAGEVVLAVIAWAAKMERLAIRERLDEARARATAAGKTWGRPARMTRDQVREARAMQSTGRSVRAIAMALKVPKSTILRALRPSQKWPAMAHTKPLQKTRPRKR
jgi:DNA invertase Pin-like site-specific DNA recombinase